MNENEKNTMNIFNQIVEVVKKNSTNAQHLVDVYTAIILVKQAMEEERPLLKDLFKGEK